jgi:hypothetical protein
MRRAGEKYSGKTSGKNPPEKRSGKSLPEKHRGSGKSATAVLDGKYGRNRPIG